MNDTVRSGSGGAARFPRGSLLRPLGYLIGVVGGGFVVRILAAQWEDVTYALQRADLQMLCLAFGIGLAGMTQIGLGWGRLIRLLGGRLSKLESLRSYFVGQLGKYIPGGIWPVVGRSELARRAGIPASIAYAGTLLSLGVTYLAAALTVAVLFPVGTPWDVGPVVAWGVAVLPAVFCIVALSPAGVGAISRATTRVTGLDIRSRIPAWPVIVLLIVRHVLAWLTISLATFTIGSAFGAEGEFWNVAFATTLAWLAGFLALPVPGGLGVREAAFVAVASTLPTSMAAVVAVTARLLFVSVDASAAAFLHVITPSASTSPTADQE